MKKLTEKVYAELSKIRKLQLVSPEKVNYNVSITQY